MSIPQNEPLLGLATTEELFREIIARFAMLGRYPGPVERALVLAEMLGGLSAEDREYRTADPDDRASDVFGRGR